MRERTLSSRRRSVLAGGAPPRRTRDDRVDRDAARVSKCHAVARFDASSNAVTGCPRSSRGRARVAVCAADARRARLSPTPERDPARGAPASSARLAASCGCAAESGTAQPDTRTSPRGAPVAGTRATLAAAAARPHAGSVRPAASARSAAGVPPRDHPPPSKRHGSPARRAAKTPHAPAARAERGDRRGCTRSARSATARPPTTRGVAEGAERESAAPDSRCNSAPVGGCRGRRQRVVAKACTTSGELGLVAHARVRARTRRSRRARPANHARAARAARRLLERRLLPSRTRRGVGADDGEDSTTGQTPMQALRDRRRAGRARARCPAPRPTARGRRASKLGGRSDSVACAAV